MLGCNGPHRHCNVMDHTVTAMRKEGMFAAPIDIAIDKHNIGRFDKSCSMINMIKSKPKNGTCNFNCLATVNCVVRGSRAFLDALLVRRDISKEEIISHLIERCKRKGIMIRSRNIDREFFTVKVIKLLDEKKIIFRMPATKTPGIKKAVEQYKRNKRKAVSTHSIKSKDGTADFTLIILEKDDGEIHTFATNMSIDAVNKFSLKELTGIEAFAEDYRLRWGIDAGYRDYDDIRPKTTSRNETIRTLLMFFPFFMYNAWTLALYLCGETKDTKILTFKLLLAYFIKFVCDPTQDVFPPKHLTCPVGFDLI